MNKYKNFSYNDFKESHDVRRFALMDKKEEKRLEKLQASFRSGMAGLESFQRDGLTDSERAKRDNLLADVKEVAREIDKFPRIRESESGTTYLLGDHEERAGGDGLVFETRDGRKVEALPLEKRFVDLAEKRSEFDDIGPGSLGRVIRAKILGDFTGLSEQERRAFGEGTGSLGGFFVPSLVSGYVIDLARNNAAVMQAGAWTLPMDGPEITLVKVLTDPTGHWVGEHTAITESTGSFGPVTLKAMVLGALVSESVALLEDSQNAGATIESMLSAALGLELDRVCLFGDGANEPAGLEQCADINEYSMGANGATPTNYDPFSYAVQYVLEDNGQPSAAIMAPRTFGTIDRLKEGTTNAPLGAPQSYQALKKFYTNQIPVNQTKGTATTCSSAFVGDFTNIVLGMRRQLSIDISPYAGTDTFAKVEALIRAYMRVDVAVLRENHFCKITGIKP